MILGGNIHASSLIHCFDIFDSNRILHIYEDEVFVGVSNIMFIGMHAGLVFMPF